MCRLSRRFQWLRNGSRMLEMKLGLRLTSVSRSIRLWALPSKRIKSLPLSWQPRRRREEVLKPACRMPRTRLRTNAKNSIILR